MRVNIRSVEFFKKPLPEIFLEGDEFVRVFDVSGFFRFTRAGVKRIVYIIINLIEYFQCKKFPDSSNFACSGRKIEKIQGESAPLNFLYKKSTDKGGMMMNDWPRPHYFFAVKLPDETKSFLSRWVGGAFPKDWFGRWVYPLDYHITMAFLGNVKENKVKDFSLRMADMLKGETAFPLTLGETGYFGKKDSPRVFWAGVQDSPPLAELQRKIFRLCLDEGFRLDQKPFRPHITLARKGTEHLEPGSSRSIIRKAPPIPFSSNRSSFIRRQGENPRNIKSWWSCR